MNLLPIACCLTLSIAVPAQQDAPADPQATDARLQQQLRSAASVSNAAFEAVWRWPTTVSGTATRSRSGGSSKEQLRGRIYADALLLEVEQQRLVTVTGTDSSEI